MIKPTRQVMVQFQLDENIEEKRPRRMKSSFIQPEIQSWSRFSQDDEELVDSKEERLNRSRLTLIERNPRRQSSDYHQLTFRSIFGTMSHLDQFLQNKHSFQCFPFLKTILIFLDSSFRSIGQINFSNNPLSGLVSLIQYHHLHSFCVI